MVTTRRATRAPAHAAAAQASVAPTAPRRRRVRTTINAWWCPDDDRAMQNTNPPTPCDVCGKSPAEF
jgi:hypothetical protein